MTPAWWKSASTAASEPASAAVCEPAARAPAPIGRLHRKDRLLAREPAREARELARVAEGLEVQQDESVSASSSQYSSRSFDETSALFPIETKPRARGLARRPARAARGRARRSATRSRRCRAGAPGANVAFRRAPATAMPRQFGPTSRAPARARARGVAPGARALGADLGEAGRDDAERLHALPRAPPRRRRSPARRGGRRRRGRRRPGCPRSTRSARTPATGSALG